MTLQPGQQITFIDVDASPNAFVTTDYSDGTTLTLRLDDVRGKRLQIDLPPSAFLELLATLREYEDEAQDMAASEDYAAKGEDL